MRTRRPRSLIRQDGRNLAFCHLKFRKALSRFIDKRRDEGQRITQTQLCQNLADHLHLSQDSIDNYRKGYNGPASIEVVKDMAGYLEVEWTELMKEVTPMADKMMMQMEEKIEKSAGKETGRKEKPASSEERPMTSGPMTSEDTPAISADSPVSPAENIAETETNCAAPLTEFEKASAWIAVRDVYKALQVFVSFFEGDYSVVLDLNDTSSDPVIRTYNYCWKVLHRNMLDIPDRTYEKLATLTEELQFWIYGLPTLVRGEYDPEDVTYSPEYFGRLRYLELNEEFNTEYTEWAETVTTWLVDDFYNAIRRILKKFIPREPAAGMGCPQRNPDREE